MKAVTLVALSMLLDLAFGDPPGVPHPVRTIGSAIAAGEGLARNTFPGTPGGERCAGALLTLAIGGATYAAASVLSRIPALELTLAAGTLALRDLLDHVHAVLVPLQAGDLPAARERLSRVVGRDTASLSASGIARAAIETLAESTCDGVIAPLLYLTIGGAPLALAYKAVNTLDSTIGHIEDPYRYFGAFAARLDDVANFVPARISAACIATASAILFRTGADALETWRSDASGHRSPNAGQVEAAMAGALNVRLGGANRYDGVEVAGAVFGRQFREPEAADVARAMRVTLLASGVAYLVAVVAAVALDARS
jgi:adenosylcobinamide-phosphate synthase